MRYFPIKYSKILEHLVILLRHLCAIEKILHYNGEEGIQD